MTVTLNIKVNSEINFTVEADPSITVKDLKVLCESQSNVEAQNQRLICKGKLLKDTDVLSEVGVNDGATVYLVRTAANKPQSTVPTPSAPPQSPVQTSAQPWTAPPNVNPPQGQGFSGYQQPTYQQDPFQSLLSGGLPNLGPNQLMELLNNPMAQEAMQRLTQNPEVLRSIMQSSPIMNPLLEQNSMLSEMLSNPELMRSMMRPEVLQAGLQMHQAMQQQQMQPQQQGQQPPQAQPNLMNPQNPAFSDMMRQMMNVFQQNPAAAQATPPPVYTDTRPPAERFSTQLQALTEMGFFDTEKNISALIATNGDLNATVSRLLESNS